MLRNIIIRLSAMTQYETLHRLWSCTGGNMSEYELDCYQVHETAPRIVPA